MKTQWRKYLAIGALVCAMPLVSFSQAQYDNSMQPADPGDTGMSAQDQQLDSAEQQQTAPPDQAPVSTQVFYNELSPYGQWVNMPTYGYVWMPNAGPGFVPYSNYGHWVYTVYGWTWVSDYAWGWAPFHYGRWEYDANYGWFWIPDVCWGPAWVCWRHCDGYYGWAPLGWHMNISIGYYGDYGIPASRWMFVDEHRIYDRHIYNYYEPRKTADYLYGHSSVVAVTHYDDVHKATYAAGPHVEDVEKATGAKIRQVPVRAAAAPGQRYDNAHLHIYKPVVSSSPERNGGKEPTPQQHVEVNQVPKRSEYQPTFHNNPAPQRSAPEPQRSVAPQRSYSPPPQRSAPSGGGGGGRGRR